MPNFNTNHGLTDGERKLGSRGGGLSNSGNCSSFRCLGYYY